MAEQQEVVVPPKRFNTDYPVIDTDPHWRRAFRYARRDDWVFGTTAAGIGPAFMLTTERFAPSFSGKGAFGPSFRLSIAIGALAGLGLVYQQSCLRFYGYTENAREVDMDMKEMVAKGVAARNSRYSALLMHIVPWANFTNHNMHGIDTAKYYQQAERELEAEKAGES